ncbi:MAG: MurR/RpiR family transcriptional regulator [Ruminococcus sp.]|nr:MurR/RpiR family transcriptional regulator [Ruminococcus sp.]MDO4419328.1 MurR/RpiR family transcriptional regulator [Ruminococcus sp.]
MVTHLLGRIDMKLSSMSKGQKLIAHFIEQHYDQAAFLTASKLGELVGVSESTVVRFATEIGYSGYPELQKAMQEMIKDKLTSVQRIDVTAAKIENNDVLGTVLNQDIQKIRHTIEETSREDFKRAVNSIINAEHIYIYGARSASALANFLGYYFGLIFDNVHIITTGSRSGVYEGLFRISDKDALIGISFPRYSRVSVNAMSFAHSRGASTISITDNMLSPLVPHSSSVLIARSDMASVVDSLVAPLSLINALIVATVIEKKDDVKATFEALESVWNEQGVYASSELQFGGDKV